MTSRAERARPGGAVTRRAWLGALLAGGGAATAAGLLARCGAYGGDPHGGYRSLTPPDNAWRLYYLDPPWVVIRNDATGAVVRVPPAYGPSVSSVGFEGIMEVTVSRTAAASPEAAVGAFLEARRASGWRDEYAPRATWVSAPSVALAPADAGPMPPVDAGADAGVSAVPAAEAAATDGVFFERCVAARLADGGVVVLLFHSIRSLAEDPEITAMIRLFEPRPPAGMR